MNPPTTFTVASTTAASPAKGTFFSWSTAMISTSGVTSRNRNRKNTVKRSTVIWPSKMASGPSFIEARFSAAATRLAATTSITTIQRLSRRLKAHTSRIAIEVTATMISGSSSLISCIMLICGPGRSLLAQPSVS